MKAEEVVLLLLCIFAGIVFCFVWFNIIKGLAQSASKRSQPSSSSPGSNANLGGNYVTGDNYYDKPSEPTTMSLEELREYEYRTGISDDDNYSDDEPKGGIISDFWDDVFGRR